MVDSPDKPAAERLAEALQRRAGQGGRALSLEALEARVARLEARLKGDPAANPLALATDLIDLGEVPSCAMHKENDQTISNNSVTEIDFGSVTWDTDQMADIGNNGITIQRAGLYLVTLQTRWATNATGFRHQRVRVNDTIYFSGQSNPSHATTACWLSSASLRYLDIGDTLTVEVRQTSGGDLALLGSTATVAGPQLSATLIADTGDVRTEMA